MNRKRNLVLVVEDDDDLAFTFCSVLGDIFDVERSATATTAIARMKADPPIECVVLDLGLPNGRGISLVSDLQREFPKIPMVVVTGLEFAARDILLKGAQDFIPKPVTAEVLLDVVAKAIIRHEVRSRYETVEKLVPELRKSVDKSTKKIDDLLSSTPPLPPLDSK